VIIDAEHNPEAINVETQQNNPQSLLWWTKRLIALRKRYSAFGRGAIEFLHPDNRRVLVFVRTHGEEKILVVANLSRFTQYVEVDLSKYRGLVPVEMFGSNEFPAIGDLPYLLTIGPHGFYWFSLEPPRNAAAQQQAPAPLLKSDPDWEQLVQRSRRFEHSLTRYLTHCRWFGGKARRIKTAEIIESIRLPLNGRAVQVAFVRVGYVEGEPETYLLPIARAAGDSAQHIQQHLPHTVIARLDEGDQESVLYDAAWDSDFAKLLLEVIGRKRRFKGRSGTLSGAPTPGLRRIAGGLDTAALTPNVIRAEQSNTSILFGERLILKLIRRIENGANPDVEISRFLTERARFAHTPATAGVLTYQADNQTSMSLGTLQAFVPNEGDAWRFTLHALDLYFENVLTHKLVLSPDMIPTAGLFELTQKDIPVAAQDAISRYIESARLLGQRTAEMHLALESAPDLPDFAPEPLTILYQRSLYQSLRAMSGEVFDLLRRQLRNLSGDGRGDAEHILQKRAAIDTRFRRIVGRKMTSARIRCHGDYHLGQVLNTGKDFVIIDFEGEPARALSDRRLKRPALRDVAGMIRSFHYAAYTALLDRKVGSALRAEDQVLLEPWVHYWFVWTTTAFLRSYCDATAGSDLVPHSLEDRQTLLDVFLLEKALYEVKYELNNRPKWVSVPLKGIRQMMDGNV